MTIARDTGSPLNSPVLEGELLDAIVAQGQVKTFPRHTIVILEGETAGSLFVVLKGRLKVYVSDDSGREAELNVLGPGEYFGELMLASATRTASVRTLERSELCMIRRPEFEEIVALRPDIAFHLIQTLIYRVRVLTDAVQQLTLLDVYGRASRLLREVSQVRDGRRVVVGMSQQKIADRTGASRSMINRVLKELSEGGYVTVTRQEIVILRDFPKHW